jgi:alpha-beta hydrolase superfamily lysophospholipase
MKKESSKRRWPSIIRWILWVLLVQFILINISASLYAYRLTHFYNDSTLLRYKPSSNIFAKTWKLFTGPKLGKAILEGSPDFRVETIVFQTVDGTRIDCWYSKTDSSSRGTVVLFHGLTVNKLAVLSEANEFRFMGYNVLLVDFRAHGNSGGNTSTIGYRESEEVKLAYDWLIQKGEQHIFFWGSSMGAVAIPKAIAQYSLKPLGIILEMPFESMQSHLKARARILGFPQQPFAFLVTMWIGIERGFNAYKHQSTSYLKKINCPVLMQWGVLDNYVLRPEAERVYDAISSKEKKWVIYENAGHESMLRTDPLKWRIEVGDFLSANNH